MNTTFKQARKLAKSHFADDWFEPIDGTLYVAPTGWQDDEVWLVSVGARESLVDGAERFARFNDVVVVVDKLTGKVGELNAIRDADRIAAMVAA